MPDEVEAISEVSSVSESSGSSEVSSAAETSSVSESSSSTSPVEESHEINTNDSTSISDVSEANESEDGSSVNMNSWFNSEDGSVSSTEAADAIVDKASGLKGDTTQEQIWNYLTENMGLNESAAAGVMGNIAQESSYIVNNVQDSYEDTVGNDKAYTEGVDNGTISRESFINDSAGYGIVQYSWSGYKEGLYDLAQEKGTSVGDLETQLEYLSTVVSPELMDKLNGATSVEDATRIFELEFEQAEVPEMENREAYAREAYNQFVGGNTGSISPTQEVATTQEGKMNPALYAEQYLDQTTHDIEGLDNLAKWIGYDNNCANFVSACLQNTGMLEGHYDAVEDLEVALQTQGYELVDRSEAQPGDVWIRDDRGHTEFVYKPAQDGNPPQLIGSNNNGDDIQEVSISETSGATGVFYRKVN